MKDNENAIENKHAYLIMAHNKFEQLEILLKLLDDSKHDFFIHIDKKAVDFNRERLSDSIKYSKIFFVERTSVTWGGYSQINCELLLLKTATKEYDYEYYHLLSGVDLPIKNKNEIYQFFHSSGNKNFLTCEKEFIPFDRIKYYYFFQEKVGRRRSFLSRLQSRFITLQKIFKVDRCRKKNIVWGKGGNWFSITDDLARYVLTKEKWIRKVFSRTRCADEMFLQTIVLNSEYKNTLYVANEGYSRNVRFIDWERRLNYGPHTFRVDDFDKIISSDCMFARKFDIDIDREIIEKIYQEFI